MSFGNVTIKMQDNTIEAGKLLEFTTIPVKVGDAAGDFRAIVYGIVELDNGNFQAFNLKYIRRNNPVV